MRTASLFFLLIVSCATTPEPQSLLQVENDPRSKECSYTVFIPRHLSTQSRIIALQLGSDAYVVNPRMTRNYLNQISPEILEQNIIVELNQPGTFVEQSLYGDVAAEALASVNQTTSTEKRKIFFLNRHYQWSAADFAQCYVKALREVLVKFDSHPIDLFGVSMGGDIMVRVLSQSQKSVPRVYARIEKLFLVSAILERPRDILFRQIDVVNKTLHTRFDKVSVYDSLVKLKDTDFDLQGKRPDAESWRKLRMPSSSFTNSYLRSVLKEGAAIEILESLIKSPKASVKVFAYHGLHDWNAGPEPVRRLRQQRAKTSVYFYNAEHTLSGITGFRRDIRSDLQAVESISRQNVSLHEL